eukprot:Skav232582  [mRNA]  locus=scaffold932:80382:86688:- [translate_table: standard]
MAMLLLRRDGGLLLALPSGALSEEVLSSAAEGDPFMAYGAHTTVAIRPGLVVGEAGDLLDILIIDVDSSVVNHLSEMPAEVPEGTVMFGPEPSVLPDIGLLMEAAREWVAASTGDPTIAFYSAAEEVVDQAAASKAAPSTKRAPKAKAKRVTAAGLSEQVEGLALLIPALNQQITSLKEGQESLRAQIAQQGNVVPPRASQMPVSAPLQAFAKMMGSPPRTRPTTAAAMDPATAPQMTTTLRVQGEEVEHHLPGGGVLAQAVLAQSQALTNLVSQLQQGGDPLLDGQGGASAFSLGSRGAQGRERLQMELANRSGGFFMTVLANAFKRMKPATKAPSSIQAAQGTDFSMVNYLEKFGGYGACREMGLVQFVLGHIFDCALQDDMDGVREHVKRFRTATGGGLHPEPQERAHQEAHSVATISGPSGISEAKSKEEAQMAKRRRRRARQQEKRRGPVVSMNLDPRDGDQSLGGPSPCSSSSAQPAQSRVCTVKNGRGPWEGSEGHDGNDDQDSDGGRPDFIHEFNAASLEAVPISTWAERQVRRLLASRTSFSLYLLRSITLCRHEGTSVATALFPIPIPFYDIWDGGPKKMNKAARNLRARRKLLHVAVMALNFLHDRAPLSCLGLLRRKPARHHHEVYARLMTMIKACVLSGDATIARCGRKSFQLSARIHELYTTLSREGLFSKSKYHATSEGVSVDLCNDKAEELRPYRDLDAGRLKLTGKGQWDCVPFLDNLLYMPYLEPAFNEFNIMPPADKVPDVSKESRAETEKLAKVWDANGLLRIVPPTLAPNDLRLFCRVFNNYKSSTADRQIGDRRGQNFKEGKIEDGPSCRLPAGPSLLQIMPRRFVEGLRGYVTDRRDFYHQFKTSWERSLKNVVFPALPISSLRATQAFEEFQKTFMVKKKKGDRTVVGDDLGGNQKSILVAPESDCFVAFGALFQGDHIGVEAACSAHENLLKSYGLLCDSSRHLNNLPIADDQVTEGLVIDDYFVIERCDLSAPIESPGLQKLKKAKEIYSGEDIYGSDDKDVVGDNHFKVIGAEVDSRPELVREGAVLVAAPAGKRLGLASATALAATWSYTSDSLHPGLVGAMVSASMFRRPAMAIMNHVFKVIAPESLNTNEPVLHPLPRRAAEELALFAALCPVLASNVAVPIDQRIYATAASSQKGGIAEAKVDEEVAKMMWRSADKKGANLPLPNRTMALLRSYDDDEELELPSGFDHDDGAKGVERPIGLRFEFAEIFGGAGIVTKFLCRRGVVCAPVLDLSYSPHYNIAIGRVVEWVIFMLEEKRILAVLVAPPCTSFSPAAHPAVRSYENPMGFNRKLGKVLVGNRLAGGAMSIMFACRRTHSPGMLEQPRRSKMRWLQMWKQLLELGMDETFLASCSFGSIHMKEFCLATFWMDASSLARPCTRDHEHVKIQGAYTRPSATYCDGLADEMARVFDFHIAQKKKELLEDDERSGDGLEDPLSNDVALSLRWKTLDAWRWKGQSHINLLETASTLRLMRKKAKEGGDVRFVYLGDSHVSRSSLARGRTSSDALRPFLRQSASLQIAYGLYPAGRFTPTRMMPADCPTRDKEIPPPVPCSIVERVSRRSMQLLANMPKKKRWLSNWVRLLLLLSPSALDFYAEEECFRKYPVSYHPPPLPSSRFDASLGFPGEGPSFGFSLTSISLGLMAFYWISSPTLLALGVLPAGVLGARDGVSFTSHGDRMRKMAREGIELADGRRTTEVTAAGRVDLLSRFTHWLDNLGINFDEVFVTNPPNLDEINKILVDFGRWLFREGKPYYHYSETINAISSRRPVLRRSLQQAWDLAFMWGSFEPTEHHVGMPFQVLLAMLSLMLVWGWKTEAACIALSWGALLRIGEVFQAVREDLILPSDVSGSISYILIRIREPKTRFRSAKHQCGKMEQPDLMEVVELGFAHLKKGEPLWPLSASTLRHRFSKVLQALRLPHRSGQRPKALTLASLRAGGATWLITGTESADLVQRRGRWASRKVMEIYLQEVGAASYLNDLDKSVKTCVLDAMALFPEVLATVNKLDAMHFPSPTWPWMISHGTL